MHRLLKFIGLLASLASLLTLLGPARPTVVRAQTLCPGGPTGVSTSTYNAIETIDSAIEVLAFGCPAGTQIGYWVYIPASGSHAVAWHEFDSTTYQGVWLDLSRNELHPTEYPAGMYQFAACGSSTCAYSYTLSLSPPAGTICTYPCNSAFNPWAGGSSNMQWNHGLCENNGSCASGSQYMYGWLFGFRATANTTAYCPSNCFYQNINAYFTAPNDSDNTGGFTQLIINHETNGYAFLFAEFSSDVVYCRQDSSVGPTNPSTACSSALYGNDGAIHEFWAEMTSGSNCTDRSYTYCLKVYDDERWLAEERMKYGGLLHSPYIQNETYTTDSCSVWAAQLSYIDYSLQSICSMNDQLAVFYQTDHAYYQASLGGAWNWLYNNAGDAGSRSISNGGTTFDVYCGAFTSSFPSSTSMQYGNYSNAHPCVGGQPN